MLKVHAKGPAGLTGCQMKVRGMKTTEDPAAVTCLRCCPTFKRPPPATVPRAVGVQLFDALMIELKKFSGAFPDCDCAGCVALAAGVKHGLGQWPEEK